MPEIIIASDIFDNSPLNAIKMELVGKIVSVLIKHHTSSLLKTYLSVLQRTNPSRGKEFLPQYATWFDTYPLKEKEPDLNRKLQVIQQSIGDIIHTATEGQAKNLAVRAQIRLQDYDVSKESAREDRTPGSGPAVLAFERKYGPISILGPKVHAIKRRAEELSKVYPRSLAHNIIRWTRSVKYPSRMYTTTLEPTDTPAIEISWEALEKWDKDFSLTAFASISDYVNESAILRTVGETFRQIIHAKNKTEVSGFSRLLERRVADLKELTAKRLVNHALRVGDKKAKSLGMSVKNLGPASREYKKSSEKISMEVRESGIAWSIDVGSKSKKGTHLWGSSAGLLDAEGAVDAVFAELFKSKGGNIVTQSERAKMIRSVIGHGALFSTVMGIILAILTSVGLLVVFNKHIFRKSRQTYYKFKLLLDDWRKKGWVPGKKLTPKQRLELIAFIEGLSPEELRAAIHGSKEMRPLKPMYRGF